MGELEELKAKLKEQEDAVAEKERLLKEEKTRAKDLQTELTAANSNLNKVQNDLANAQRGPGNTGPGVGSTTPSLPIKQEYVAKEVLTHAQKDTNEYVEYIKTKEVDKDYAEKRNKLQTALTKTLDEYANLEDSTAPSEKMMIESTIVDMLNALKVNVRKPTMIEEVRNKSLQGGDARGVVSKIVSRIPKFDGKTTTYSWSHFLTCFSIAVGNASYQDFELRAIFLNCLEGNALEHYRANQENYRQLGYQDLVEKFQTRYGEKSRTSISSLVGITQGSNEDVLSFRDRMVNAAHAVMPIPPSRLIYIVVGGETKAVPNPKYVQEQAVFEAVKIQNDAYLTQFFVAGLREEILMRMTSTKFDSLEKAVEAAQIAEEYLKSVQQIRVSHLRVNAVTNPLREMEERSSNYESSSKGGPCFKCGRMGHWKNECRARSASRERYAQTQRPRSRSRSTGRKSSERKDLVATVEKLTEKVNYIHKKFERSNSKSRSRSKSRGSGSKSRSGSKGSSYSKSRSGSRDRSGEGKSRNGYRSRSRDRKGRSRSRSGSRNYVNHSKNE